MLAVDLMSYVKVGTIKVLLELTKKSLTSRMFDLDSEKMKCVYYKLIRAHDQNMQIIYLNV